MATELRRARMRDTAMLLPLWQAAHTWHVDSHPRYFAPIDEDVALDTIRHELEGATNDQNQLWMLASDSAAPERLLGFAHARVRRPAPISALVPMLRLELVQILVAEDARRQHIGSQLLEAVRTWGRERGARELVLTVWDGNDAAVRFYAHHGMVILHQVLASPIAP